jgi:hypothetical protein
MDTTARSLLEFFNKASAKGLIKPAMAGRLVTAVKKVLEIDELWTEIDLAHVDAQQWLARFRNLKGREYSPSSLIEYERRFKRAMAMFLNYASDPSGWKLDRRAPGRKQAPAKRSMSKTKQNVAPPIQNEPVEAENVVDEPAGVHMIDYPFPLREGCLVRLHLPADLTTVEVKRLAAFMRSVAVDPG